MNNIAFIDGQNLNLGTKSCDRPWEVDLIKFRKYLQYKYKADEVYYFLGYVQNKNENLYDKIQQAGYIIKFREHNSAMLGTKKGNVDSDIIFNIMKKLYLKEDFKKIVLVSGDGDYKMLVDFLIEVDKFETILFPNKKFVSSLYRNLGVKYFAYLEEEEVKRKIGKDK